MLYEYYTTYPVPYTGTEFLLRLASRAHVRSQTTVRERDCIHVIDGA